MADPQDLADELEKKLQGEPIDLQALAARVTAALAADPGALKGDAATKYEQITEFIKALNPYGEEVVAFPSLEFENTAQRVDLANLHGRGIDVAGWLRHSHSEDPMSSSDMEMMLANKDQCFYWNFRFPDDPAGADPKGGDMKALQITKAIRIPFIYRRGDQKLLLGHIVIGYEGAGSM